MKEEHEKFLKEVEQAVEAAQSHEQLVRDLAKPGGAVLSELTPKKAHLMHMILGVFTEAGELADAIKRHTIYSRDADRENIVEELGDLAFYVEGIKQTFNITETEILSHNVAKLRKRYPTGKYMAKDAEIRADKVQPVKACTICKQPIPDGTDFIRGVGGFFHIECANPKGDA